MSGTSASRLVVGGLIQLGNIQAKQLVLNVEEIFGKYDIFCESGECTVDLLPRWLSLTTFEVGFFGGYVSVLAMITGSRVPRGLFDTEVLCWSYTVLDHYVTLLVEVKEYVGLSNELVYTHKVEAADLFVYLSWHGRERGLCSDDRGSCGRCS